MIVEDEILESLVFYILEHHHYAPSLSLKEVGTHKLKKIKKNVKYSKLCEKLYLGYPIEHNKPTPAV